MELKFLTPTEVWEGFNPIKEPLETSIISSEQTDNLVKAKQFFTAETTLDGRIRVYTEICYDSRWSDDRATVLVVPSLNLDMNYDALTKELVGEGYVVCIIDYCGNFQDTVCHTTFPKSFSFASYPVCKSHLKEIKDTARNTPWFVWAKIARRAIPMLQEHRLVADDRIGVIGIGYGAQIAWQVEGIDGRVRALVPINGDGYMWAEGRPRFTSDNIPSSDEERAFSTGVGAETYAKFVSCPTLLVMSSSSRYCDIDRAGDILALVNAESKQLLISRGVETQITRRAFAIILKWLRKNFALDGTSFPQPSISFEQIEQKLYLRFNTAKKAVSRQAYICYDEPSPFARYWKVLEDLQKTDKHEYTCSIPVASPDELILAYATFEYLDGNVVSTPVIGTIPSKLGVTVCDEEELHSSHIIYNGNMGLGSFAASTNTVFLEDDVLTQADGPFKIKGIMTKDGDLHLYRSTHEIKTLDRSTAFKFDAYTPISRNLTIKVLTYPEKKQYTAHITLNGGEYWQNILLENTDFKSDEGKTLQRFSDTKICTFVNSKNIIFNNLLWI